MTKEEREKAIEFGKMWLDMNEDAKDSETYLFFTYALEELNQKIGHWEKYDTGHSIYYSCSKCGCVAPCTETADVWIWKLSNYCPDCGRKMDNVDRKLVTE